MSAHVKIVSYHKARGDRPLVSWSTSSSALLHYLHINEKKRVFSTENNAVWSTGGEVCHLQSPSPCNWNKIRMRMKWFKDTTQHKHIGLWNEVTLLCWLSWPKPWTSTVSWAQIHPKTYLLLIIMILKALKLKFDDENMFIAKWRIQLDESFDWTPFPTHHQKLSFHPFTIFFSLSDT